MTNCDFSENLGGAWFINNNALSVTKCDFNVGNTSYSSTTYFETYGLYLESCTGYQVEENIFHDGLLGMVVYNSGQNENEIYFNDFYNLSENSFSTGLVAIGVNAKITAPTSGLQFMCNKFTNTSYALGIPIGSIPTINGNVTVTKSYIRVNQGWDVTNNCVKAANNVFCYTPPIASQGDFYVYSSAYNYKYYSKYNGTADRSELVKYNSDVIDASYSGIFTTRTQECPSNLDDGLLLLSGFTGISELNEEEIRINDEIEDLTANINETALMIAAQTANQNNAGSVHNLLMAASPYLSDTILSVFLNNANVSEYSRATIMVANSPLPTSVKSEIFESELSDELKAYINQFQDGVNLLEQKYLRLESIKEAKQQLYDNVCLAAIQLDTTAYFNQTIELLELSNDIHAKECLANLYVHNFEYDKALDIYESLINIAEMDNNTLLFNNSKIQK